MRIKLPKTNPQNSPSNTNPLSSLDSLIGEPILSAYIVGGSDSYDYLLCQNIEDGGHTMIFERDLARCGEVEILFHELRGVKVWYRNIDDGTNSVMKSIRNIIDTDEPVVNEVGSEEIDSWRVSSGSLDQFWIGTGLPPEIIKINIKRCVLDVLHGCKELLNFCSPHIILRSEICPDREKSEFINYLSRIGYKVFDLETNEFVGDIEGSISSKYLLASRSIDRIKGDSVS